MMKALRLPRCKPRDGQRRPQPETWRGGLLPPSQFIYPLRELFHIALVHDQRRNDDLLVCRDERFVALERLGHQFDGLVAELERLLDDGGVDQAVMDAG